MPVTSNQETVTINESDIQIGAVEIKNATDETRAVVKSDGVNNALVITQNNQPLPSGAATEAKQDTGNTSLASIDGKLTDNATATNQTTGNASLSSIDSKVATAANQTNKSQFSKLTDGTNDASVTAGGALKVDGSATTQPVSAASLPLPTGASTEAKQDTGNTSLASIDGKVATAAKQDTGNTSLSSIDGKLNSLGQKTMANSVPVAIASDQSSVSVNGTRFDSDLNVSSFDLSTADTSFSSVEFSQFDKCSAQLVWSGATSSDAFATPGTFELQISNDNSNWETIGTVSIDAASGSDMIRNINFDFRYIRWKWTKNASTAGSATCFGTFKGV